MDKAVTVYVLKNHNGTFLSAHTDASELAAAMSFYELQTGNSTLIAVRTDSTLEAVRAEGLRSIRRAA